MPAVLSGSSMSCPKKNTVSRGGRKGRNFLCNLSSSSLPLVLSKSKPEMFLLKAYKIWGLAGLRPFVSLRPQALNDTRNEGSRAPYSFFCTQEPLLLAAYMETELLSKSSNALPAQIHLKTPLGREHQKLLHAEWSCFRMQQDSCWHTQLWAKGQSCYHIYSPAAIH